MIVCSKRRCLILAGLLLGVVHCGPIGIPVERLARETRYCSDYRDYRKLNGEKAWAVAGDPCGVFVAGLTYEQADAATAESRALLLCEARRVDRKVEAPCVVHARGDCATASAALRYCRSLPGVPNDCPDRIEAEGANCPGGSR
jgi:hypothetical protein